MDCSKCHSPIEPGKKFCAECGAKAGAVAPDTLPARGPSVAASPLSPKSEGDDSDYLYCGLGVVISVIWLLGVIFHAGGYINIALVAAIAFYWVPWIPERRLKRKDVPSDFPDEQLYGFIVAVLFTILWGIGVLCHAGQNIRLALIVAAFYVVEWIIQKARVWWGRPR